MSNPRQKKPKAEVSMTFSSSPPRLSDEEIRKLVDDAMMRGDLWAVAEFMRNVRQNPPWDAAWLAVERLFVKVRDVRQSRVVSYIGREFMPPSPARISVMIAEGAVWMAKRLQDRAGYASATQRLELLQQRLSGKASASEPPKMRTEPDAPERVLNDYVRMVADAGLRLKFTKPAMRILVALPVPWLKAAISGVADQYDGTGVPGSSTVVTLGILRRHLPSLRNTHPGTVAP